MDAYRQTLDRRTNCLTIVHIREARMMLISSRTVLVFVKVGGSIPGPEAQRPRKISENSGRHLATAAAGCRHRRATAGDALEMFEAWAQATD